jgi:hypothetical protein
LARESSVRIAGAGGQNDLALLGKQGLASCVILLFDALEQLAAKLRFIWEVEGL